VSGRQAVEVIPDDEETAAEDARMRAVRMQMVPVKPTSQREIDEHEATGHAVYRAWCAHCVGAYGLEHQHRMVNREEDEIPVVSCDFFFMGQDEEKCVPMVAMVDNRTKTISASALPDKKAITRSNVKVLSNFFKALGYNRIINKSDNEPAIVALKTAAAREAGIEAVPKESPVGDHAANGEIENVVKDVQRKIRANKSSLEAKLKMKLEDRDPVVQWLPRFSADQVSRFKVGADGKTAEQRRTGRAWHRFSFEFGEQIMFKPVGTKGRKNDMTQKMFKGRYVGHHSRHGSVLVMTTTGVAVASSYHRLPDGERWSRDGWDKLKGFPWDVRPTHRELKLPGVTETANATDPGEAQPVPILPVTQAPATLGR
jgi:hypothetical protein